MHRCRRRHAGLARRPKKKKGEGSVEGSWGPTPYFFFAAFLPFFLPVFFDIFFAFFMAIWVSHPLRTNSRCRTKAFRVVRCSRRRGRAGIAGATSSRWGDGRNHAPHAARSPPARPLRRPAPLPSPLRVEPEALRASGIGRRLRRARNAKARVRTGALMLCAGAVPLPLRVELPVMRGYHSLFLG